MPQKLSPIKSFINFKKEVDEGLVRLQALSDAHFNIDPKNIGWGDVGYVEHIAELITNTKDFAFQEGDCSPKGDHYETIN